MSIPSGWPLFEEYENGLQKTNRFFLNEKFIRLFERITDECSNIKNIEKGKELFRARKNEKQRHFTKQTDLGPNTTILLSNRASPIGIFYMYLADTPETAIAEVRSNIDQTVTVATFIVKKKLKLLYLRNEASVNGTTDDEFDSQDVSGFIIYLSNSFTKPLVSSPEIDYLPCQYFAEYCKKQGFDGLQYISCAKGFKGYGSQVNFNYVIFDENDVSFKCAYEYHVEEISYVVKKERKIKLK